MNPLTHCGNESLRSPFFDSPIEQNVPEHLNPMSASIKFPLKSTVCTEKG